jgi:hypothetical protein
MEVGTFLNGLISSLVIRRKNISEVMAAQLNTQWKKRIDRGGINCP